MAPLTRAKQAANDKSIVEAKSRNNVKSLPESQPNGTLRTIRKGVRPHGSTTTLGFTTSRNLSEDLDPKLSPQIKSEIVQTIANGAQSTSNEHTSETKISILPQKLKQKLKSKPFESAKATAPKKKRHPYGLTPGYSPFPDHVSPTAEECRKVNDLLSKMHGVVTQPSIIPPPSSTVTGCGEVPDLLDALLRTLLSANTSNENSAKALKGLINTFGSVDGSPNWELVRQANVLEVENAIAGGGQQKNKSKYIKGILDMVHSENLAVYSNLMKDKDTSSPKDVTLKGELSSDIDVSEVKPNLLSLARIFEIKDTNETMDELLKFPGIGVKTASCVIMFCMQRPSFAVDTHVQRLTQWFGWAPSGCSENNTFSHLEVRVPNELKYALHHLFIKHGQRCFRCRANTNSASSGWDECVCPIEELVRRTGKMKDLRGGSVKKGKPSHKKVESGRVAKSKATKTRAKKGKKVEESEESEQGIDLSSAASDELSDVDMNAEE